MPSCQHDPRCAAHIRCTAYRAGSAQHEDAQVAPWLSRVGYRARKSRRNRMNHPTCGTINRARIVLECCRHAREGAARHSIPVSIGAAADSKTACHADGNEDVTRPRMRTSLVRQQSLRVGGMDDRVHREVYKMNTNVYAARVNEGMDGMFTRRDVTRGVSYVATQGRNCRAAQQTRTMRST